MAKSNVVNYLKNKAKDAAESATKKVSNITKDKVEEIIDIIEERITGITIFLLLLIIGAVFLVFSGYFFLNENLALDKSFSLLIMAVISIIAGFLIKYQAEKNTQARR